MVVPTGQKDRSSLIVATVCSLMVCGCTSGTRHYPADWPGTLVTEPDCPGIEGTFSDQCVAANLGDEPDVLCRLSHALARPVFDLYLNAAAEEFSNVESVRLARTDAGVLEAALLDGTGTIVRRGVIDTRPEHCTEQGLELVRWDGGVVPVAPIVWGVARERWLLAANSAGELVLHLDSNGAYVILVVPGKMRSHAWARWRPAPNGE